MCMLPPFFSPYFSIYLEGLETFHGLFAELRHAFSRCRPTANSTRSRALVLSSLSLSRFHSKILLTITLEPSLALSLSLSQSLALERELSSSSTLEVSLAYVLVLAPADSPISSSNTMALG